LTDKDKLKLGVDKATRADSGTYHLKLTNDAGEADCDVVILVIGKFTAVHRNFIV